MRLKHFLWGAGVGLAMLFLVLAWAVWGPLPFGATIDRQIWSMRLKFPEAWSQELWDTEATMDFSRSRLDDLTPEALAECRKTLSDNIAELESWSDLQGEEAVTQQVFLEYYRGLLAQTDFPWIGLMHSLYPTIYLLNPGFDTSFAIDDEEVPYVAGHQTQFLVQVHTVTGTKGAESYVQRLHAAARQMSQIGEIMRRQAAHGVIPPRALIDPVLAQLDTEIARPVDENILIRSFQFKLAQVERISSGDRATYLERARDAVQMELIPAYRALARLLREEIRPKSGEHAGVWRFPDGDRYYRASLRGHLGMEIDPATLHAQGMQELQRLAPELDRLLRARGLTEGTIGQRLALVRLFPGKYFTISEDIGSIRFHQSSQQLDIFQQSIFSYVYPGKYRDLHPVFGRSYFSNGSNFYYERAIAEYYNFDNNTESYFSYLYLMNYATTKSLIDTGIHVHRWTSDQAIEFFLQKTGEERRAALHFLMRATVAPGELTMDSAVALKLQEFRVQAQARLPSSSKLPALDRTMMITKGYPLVVRRALADKWAATVSDWAPHPD